MFNPIYGLRGRITLTIYWWIYKTFFFRGKKDYEETIKELDTPTKVQAWLWSNIKYTHDVLPHDHWQPPERTFERKRGTAKIGYFFQMLV